MVTQRWSLDPRPEIESFVGPYNDNLPLVMKRATALLAKKGFVLGPDGVMRGPFGGFIVDADRDPTADYLAWDPTAKSDAEVAQAQSLDQQRTQRRQLRQALTILDANHTRLAANHTTLASTTTQLNAAQLRALLDDTTQACDDNARTLAGVIRALIDLQLIEPDSA